MKSKLLLETVEADLFKEIRANFVTEGVKPTEKMVAAEVVKNKRYLGAKKNLIDATLTHSIAKAGRDAFVQRKRHADSTWPFKTTRERPKTLRSCMRKQKKLLQHNFA